MVEELYIIRNGQRHRLDLSTPSGITLNFKSNIFSDLSKITASYSYTFKLPMTANNRRVLGMADDIRCSSSFTHMKLKGEYVQNGIPLFENVNLYIDSIDTDYKCVMTWGDAMAFGQIKDDNLKLNELTAFNTTVEWSSSAGTISQFVNTAIMNNVVYNAGVTIYNFKYDSRVNQYRVAISSVPFVPVVPVYAILQAISRKYNITFPFAKPYTGTWTDEEDRFDCVNKGVIPFVNHQLSVRQFSEYAVTITSVSFSKDGPKDIHGRIFKNEITFKKFTVGKPAGGTGTGNGYIYITTTEYMGTIANGFQVSWGVKVKMTGCFRIKFSDLTGSDTPIMKLCHDKYTGYDEDGMHYEWTDVSELAGRRVQGETDLWEFDFRDTTSAVPLEYESPYGETNRIVFWFSHTITSFSVVEQFKIVPAEVSDDGAFQGKCNPMECMPETTVLDFLKSLFFMTGTFPVFKNNTLHAVSYDIFKDNIAAGNVYDWTKKLTTSTTQLPTKTSFLVSDYAKRNYYTMSTDKTNGDSSSDSNDVYQNGLASFYLGSDLISTKEKTVAKLPWAAPFLLNREFPNEKTGDTIKSWVLNKDRESTATVVKYCAPKPALGIIIQKPISHIDNLGNTIDDGKVMSLRIWNDLQKVMSSPSMAYLRQILNKPILITENFELNEFDLRDLDFSVPVYLDKYNAYFAIVSITRDSKGICKCEMIKLPHQ